LPAAAPLVNRHCFKFHFIELLMAQSLIGGERTPQKTHVEPVKEKHEAAMPAIAPPAFQLKASVNDKKEAAAPAAKSSTSTSKITIKGSVGKGGVNSHDDVIAVQGALKRVGYQLGVDGDYGPETEKIINKFQMAALGFADGKIDSSGRTLTKLNATATGAMATVASGPTTTTGTAPATPPVAATNKIAISWGANANQGAVSAYARGVISDLVIAAGGKSCTINSTARTPEDQARAMYNNLAAGNEIAYAAPGAAVTAVFYKSKKAGKTATEIKADMTAEIYKQGPSRVSRHCADFNTLCVVDIDTGSISNGKAFVKAVDGDERVSKFLHPGNSQDPAYHIEIPIH
jgi:peptidoglycan hydrolase-like protein with peptidoglycan-binding domain